MKFSVKKISKRLLASLTKPVRDIDLACAAYAAPASSVFDRVVDEFKTECGRRGYALTSEIMVETQPHLTSYTFDISARAWVKENEE